MRVSGELLSYLHRATIFTTWPVNLSHAESLYTLHIGSPHGPLLIDFEPEQLENLHHAITMLLNFPRITHIDFPVDRPAHEQSQELPLDMPLA